MEKLAPRIWILLVLAVVLAVLQYRFWFGQGNWRQVQDLRAQVAAQKIENQKLMRRNQALAAEVQDLKSGVDAVEERARNEMGMIKSGETFYRVVDPDGKLKSAEDPDTVKP